MVATALVLGLYLTLVRPKRLKAGAKIGRYFGAGFMTLVVLAVTLLGKIGGSFIGAGFAWSNLASLVLKLLETLSLKLVRDSRFREF